MTQYQQGIALHDITEDYTPLTPKDREILVSFIGQPLPHSVMARYRPVPSLPGAWEMDTELRLGLKVTDQREAAYSHQLAENSELYRSLLVGEMEAPALQDFFKRVAALPRQ